jgi:hypothetical protein
LINGPVIGSSGDYLCASGRQLGHVNSFLLGKFRVA